MAVLLFKPKFAGLVAAGKKLQTIRPQRKRPIQIGERLSLRQWSDLPYRSKQRVLRDDCICTAYEPITISRGSILKDTGYEKALARLSDSDMESFAKADGFEDWPEMRDWFENEHGLPFDGVLIKWEKDPL